MFSSEQRPCFLYVVSSLHLERCPRLIRGFVSFDGAFPSPRFTWPRPNRDLVFFVLFPLLQLAQGPRLNRRFVSLMVLSLFYLPRGLVLTESLFPLCYFPSCNLHKVLVLTDALCL